MGNILSRYIEIIIDILLLAIILLLVSAFGSLSHKALVEKTERNIIMNELTDYRAMHTYINSRVILGDDVIKFVADFRRTCDIDIVKPSETYVLEKKTTVSEDWNMQNVIEFIGDTILDKYEVTYELYEGTDVYSKIIFTLK